jgi:hypothetical protein
MKMLTVLAGLLLNQGAPLKLLTLQLGVGESKPSPIVSSVTTVCDDLTVVQVVDKGDHLELRGLKAGHTQCSFTHRPSQPAQLVDITVSGTR